MDSQWECAVGFRDLKSEFCYNPVGWDGVGRGREVQEGGEIRIPLTDAC